MVRGGIAFADIDRAYDPYEKNSIHSESGKLAGNGTDASDHGDRYRIAVYSIRENARAGTASAVLLPMAGGYSALLLRIDTIR